MPFRYYGEGLAKFYAMLFMVLIAVLGILMVSTLRRNLYLVLVIAGIGMLMWLYSQYVLLILSAAYCAHGVLWYLTSLFRRRPSVETEASANN